MKLMITGGTGMVGRNLIPRLQQLEGFQVFAPTRKELNLLEQKAVNDYIDTLKPDLIIHLAARVGGIMANVNNPVEFFTENILVSTYVITAAMNAKVPKLLNLASSCMYPRNRELLKESDILTGELEETNEGYALAKISATRLCQYISNQYKLSYKTIIPCNLYGPYDNFDLQCSHLIPAVINKIHKARSDEHASVEIWGDGQARREFLYVGDLVDFILSAIKRYADLPDIINVGLDEDYTVEDYYRAVAKIVGFKGEFTFDLSRPAGMRKKLMDVSKAHDFGWHAKTPLDVGIKNTSEFYFNTYINSTVI